MQKKKKKKTTRKNNSPLCYYACLTNSIDPAINTIHVLATTSSLPLQELHWKTQDSSVAGKIETRYVTVLWKGTLSRRTTTKSDLYISA